jgi:predicted PurR-regulated permease PerM
VWTVALHLMLIGALLYLLMQAEPVLEWMGVALLLALALDPAVRFLERRGLSRGLGVLIVVTSAVGAMTLLLATLVPMLLEQGHNLASALPDSLQRLRSSLVFSWLDQRLDLIERVQRELGERASQAAGPVFAIVGSVIHGVVATVTVAVLTIFMLLFGSALFDSLLGWVPPAHRERVVALTGRARHLVGGYVSGTLLIAGFGGVVTGLTLLLLGVPYFLPLGLAMVVLGAVPFLGVSLGGILVVGSTFLTAGPRQGVISLIVFVLYHQAENHLLQPLVQRRTIKMNPLAIAIVMLVGTAVAGVLGALLSLPFAAATHIVLEDLFAHRRACWGEPPPSSPEPPPPVVAEPARAEPARRDPLISST